MPIVARLRQIYFFQVNAVINMPILILPVAQAILVKVPLIFMLASVLHLVVQLGENTKLAVTRMVHLPEIVMAD
jgi:hypothetical protein